MKSKNLEGRSPAVAVVVVLVVVVVVVAGAVVDQLREDEIIAETIGIEVALKEEIETEEESDRVVVAEAVAGGRRNFKYFISI
jgi:hypothetical protein